MRTSHAAAALVLALAACSHEKMFRTEEELAQKSTAVPVDQPATVNRAAQVRAGPASASPVIAELPAGADVTAAASASRGFLRVRTAEGKTGFVEAGAVTVGGAGAARAGEPSPPTTGSGSGSGSGSVR